MADNSVRLRSEVLQGAVMPTTWPDHPRRYHRYTFAQEKLDARLSGLLQQTVSGELVKVGGTKMADNDDSAQWDRKKRSGFYSSVGQAISVWAAMETNLVEIAALLLGTSEEKAGLLMYSIMNFHVWLDIIDELFSIEARYQTHKAMWTVQKEKLRGMNDTRVRLAHHTALNHMDDQALRPGRHDTRIKSRKHAPLSEAEITDFITQLLDVDQALFSLRDAILGTPH
jgi:hypothetical protein